MAWSVRPLALVCLAACPAGPTTTSEDPGTGEPDSTSTDPGPTDPGSSTTGGSTTLVPTTSPDTTLDPTEDPTTTTTGEPACGNGVLEPGETCDDGNAVDGDCCSADCSVGPSEPGQECWTVTFEGTKNGSDRGVGVVLDGGTDVYVLATVVDSVQQSDILVRRYDPGAVGQWTQQFDGLVNGTDVALALTGDSAGFMISLGRLTTMQGEPSTMWLTKCTPTGQTVWSALDPGPVSGGAIAMADEAGEFIVVGAIDQGDTNAFTRRYDEFGGELWTEVHVGADGGTDSASGVAVDGAGNIIVVGREFTAAQGFNILIQQYGPDGATGWNATVDGPIGGNDWANDVAIDADDNLIVVGRLAVDGNFSDAWMRKYSATGDELWTQTYAGDAGESDEAVAVAISPTGEFAVIGQTASAATGADIFVSKRDPDGAEQWLRTHDGGSQGEDDQAGDVAIAPDGGVVAIGTVVVIPTINSDVWLRKYSP